ncbi:TDT family transporter [Alkaliphilus pronyensis]|uniref:TDT family transporter n=1 Tax=Alkaliphilus pronyensis TaxID=1482732 RepID=A0A6I0FAH2_9FIRM|nr:TDT family transporter [Alkaliphilus pronyensis]KAB3535773.1 TDT family transporter [Alkaliphilus pronyensis]
MYELIKKIPIPIAGLMLALATTGNLLLPYGNLYRNIFGLLSGAILILIITKLILFPRSLAEGFQNPVIASVMPTLSMGIMILSTYIKGFSPFFASFIWTIALSLHAVLIILLTKKYMLNFNIKKVFPSYFVVYVGIVVGSVTAPAYGLASLGQAIFWFGFVMYLALLPLVIYRVFLVKDIPEAALPTVIIFAAPASLCLAGYLSSFQVKSPIIVGFLAILGAIMVTASIMYMFKLLTIKFYPSYSAFTFPFAISTVAMKGTKSYLSSLNIELALLDYVIGFLEIWTVAMVLYVLIRYIMFLLPEKKTALKEPQ